jgi:hypothetical protein
MKKSKSLMLLSAAVVLLVTLSGCTHRAVTRISSGSSQGRVVSAEIDGKATFKQDGSNQVIKFGRHELVVGNEWLTVDGDKGKFGIPADARKVEIKVAQSVLTMHVDGTQLIRTPL